MARPVGSRDIAPRKRRPSTRQLVDQKVAAVLSAVGVRLGPEEVSISPPPKPAENESPVEFLLRVMNDSAQPTEVRMRAAATAAPFIHRKLEARVRQRDTAAERARQTAETTRFGSPLPAPKIERSH